MKPFYKSLVWIAVVLFFAVACMASALLLDPVLGVVSALLGWLLALQNPTGTLRPARDRVWHLLAGVAIAGVTLPHGGVTMAAVACCTIAALKEVWWDNQGGVPSFADFLWTCAGCCLAAHAWLWWQL